MLELDEPDEALPPYGQPVQPAPDQPVNQPSWFSWLDSYADWYG